MWAVVVREAHGPGSVEVVEVDRPHPGGADVLVKVHAAALNPVDAGIWSGVFGQPGPGDHFALGWDFSGVVVAAGPFGSFPPGTPVVGYVQGPVLAVGAQAEYVVVPASAVAVVPDGVDLTAAAALPLAGLTAGQALDLLLLKRGDTLAITGAAGAVGGYAVELARVRGLHVTGIARPGAEETVVGLLGADLFAASGERLAEQVRLHAPGGIDGVFDTIALREPAIGLVRNGGAYVTADPRDEAMPAAQRGIRRRVVYSVGDGARLSTLLEMVADGRLSLRVAATFPLHEARRAHEQLAAGGNPGKILLLA
jgi:NADPH:quinone reductase-like Zn-dependent oxidoreductase